MAFYHDPGKPHHARAVVAAWVEPGRRAAQHWACDEAGEAIEERGLKLLAHAIGDQAGDALHGLQGDVAREAVGHHDVDPAREDVIAFHEAHVVQPAAREQRVRRLHHLVSLHVLLADVEETDAWRRETVHVAGDDGAHGGELAQLLGCRLGVGAQIEHVRVTVRGGDGGDDGGALHAGQSSEHEVRDRGERSGVTRAHARAGAPVLHQIDRDAHRGVFLATDRLAWLVFHRHHLGGGHDDRALANRGRQRCQGWDNQLRLPDQLCAQLWIVAQGAQRTGNVLTRLMVAAHHIDCDRQHAGLWIGAGTWRLFFLFGLGALLDHAPAPIETIRRDPVAQVRLT